MFNNCLSDMNLDDAAGKMHDNPEPAPEKAEFDDTSEEQEQEIVEEYADLDDALNQIGSYLDELEQKNDSIYARLQDLLEQSKETRKEMETERLNRENAGDGMKSENQQSGSS